MASHWPVVGDPALLLVNTGGDNEGAQGLQVGTAIVKKITYFLKRLLKDESLLCSSYS